MVLAFRVTRFPVGRPAAGPAPPQPRLPPPLPPRPRGPAALRPPPGRGRCRRRPRAEPERRSVPARAAVGAGPGAAGDGPRRDERGSVRPWRSAPRSAARSGWDRSSRVAPSSRGRRPSPRVGAGPAGSWGAGLRPAPRHSSRPRGPSALGLPGEGGSRRVVLVGSGVGAPHSPTGSCQVPSVSRGCHCCPAEPARPRGCPGVTQLGRVGAPGTGRAFHPLPLRGHRLEIPAGFRFPAELGITFYQIILNSFSLHLMSPGGLCLKRTAGTWRLDGSAGTGLYGRDSEIPLLCC